MISEVKTTATVKPGGLVEVRSDDLTEGTTVEVIVRIKVSESQETKPKGLALLLSATEGKGHFSSIADVDEFIRQERDEWDS